jgi:hypothetical protein
MQTNIPMKRPLTSCHAIRHRWRAALSLPVLLVALGTACQSDTPTAANVAEEPTQEATASADTPPSAGSTDTTAPAPSDTVATMASSLSSLAVVGTALTNQPSGFTRIAEWSVTGMMPLNTSFTSGYGILAGKWARWWGGTALASDGSAPKSPNGMLQFTFPAGMKPGTSPGMVSMWSTTSGEEYSKVYESGWIKVPSSNFEEHAGSQGLKMLGFWAVGKKPGPNSQIYGATHGFLPNPVSAFQFVLAQQSYLIRNLWPNVDQRPLLTCGTWHHYELIMEINTLGKADGKFRMWWDNIMTHNYNNVMFRTPTYPAKFFGRKIDPTWGGPSGPNKTRTDRVWFDHIYISGMK